MTMMTLAVTDNMHDRDRRLLDRCVIDVTVYGLRRKQAANASLHGDSLGAVALVLEW